MLFVQKVTPRFGAKKVNEQYPQPHHTETTSAVRFLAPSATSIVFGLQSTGAGNGGGVIGDKTTASQGPSSQSRQCGRRWDLIEEAQQDGGDGECNHPKRQGGASE